MDELGGACPAHSVRLVAQDQRIQFKHRKKRMMQSPGVGPSLSYKEVL